MSKPNRRLRDSSKTRVEPVFERLFLRDASGESWLETLLALPEGGSAAATVPVVRSIISDYGWGRTEKKLEPPVALLSWLIRHLQQPVSGDLSANQVKAAKRQELIAGSPERIREALQLLRHNPDGEDWHLFEGKTQPDVFLENDEIIIVIEGKRTEHGPTARTKWMSCRHQMLRHLDCAFEISGPKQVVGFFIVEGEDVGGGIPEAWHKHAAETISPATVASSLPHRSSSEAEKIADGFLGVTTWQRVCHELGIGWRDVPDELR